MTFLDAYFLASAARPLTFRPIASSYFFRHRFFKIVFKLVEAIPKKVFTKDTFPILEAMRSVKKGRSIAMFPAGRTAVDGTDLPLAGAEAMAKFVKKLGLPVWEYHCHGIYFLRPKWRKSWQRVPLELTLSPLLTAEQVRQASCEELVATIRGALAVDESRVASPRWDDSMPANVSGLSHVLYRCPRCRAKHRMIDSVGGLRCEACGAEFPFSARYTTVDGWSISDWNRFQIEEMRKEPQELSASAKICRFADSRTQAMVEAGKGVVSIRDGVFAYRGIFAGQEVAFEYTPQTLEALPFEVYTCFDFFHGDEFLRIIPDDLGYVQEFVTMWDIVVADALGHAYPTS